MVSIKKRGRSKAKKKASTTEPEVVQSVSKQNIPAKQRLLFQNRTQLKKSYKKSSKPDEEAHIQISDDVKRKKPSETVNQYLRRLDKLAASAQVDADMNVRFFSD